MFLCGYLPAGRQFPSAMTKRIRQTKGDPEISLGVGHDAIPPALGWSFGFVFREADRAFGENFRRDLAPHGITLGQWYFLRELWDEEGLSQRELSKRVGVREPTTGKAIELMARRGLILRHRRPGDHRSLYIYLTPKGRALRKKILALAISFNARAVRGFTAARLHKLRQDIFQIIGNVAGRSKPRR
jgi:MarR family transcriptional regulator, organic hydroperoxide resistance regulator